jgi:hypothetical protein
MDSIFVYPYGHDNGRMTRYLMSSMHALGHTC